MGGRQLLALALLLPVHGCAAGGGGPVSVVISSDPDQDPFAEATDLAIVIERRGVVEQEVLYPIATTSGRLEAVPAGLGYLLRVEARADGVVLARGRSFPFDLSLDDPPPQPGVFVGRLGLFARSSDDLPPTSAVLAVTATSRGALWIQEDGALVEYVAHDGSSLGGRDARMMRVGTVPDALDFAWTGVVGGRLLAVGGSANEARMYDATGAVAASAMAPSGVSLRRSGGALVSVEAGRAALLVGGIPDASLVETDAVARVDVVEEPGYVELVITASSPLPSPVTDAACLDIEVRGDATCPCERVLVFGGLASGLPRLEATLLDPAGVASPITVSLGAVRPGAALASLSVGLVAVMGGEDAVGVAVPDVEILAASVDQLDVLAPSPPLLFGARRNAAATTLGDGLAMVYGGVGPDGSPLATAELVEFPGDVAPTGSMPAPVDAPRGVLLEDRSLLVVGAGTQAVFIVPRSP